MKTARKTSKEKTALERLARSLGGEVEHESGPRLTLTITTPEGKDWEKTGPATALLAWLTMAAQVAFNRTVEDVAEVTGFVGPVTEWGANGADYAALRNLAQVTRSYRRRKAGGRILDAIDS